ncbi:MAG: hypothetical protein WC712_01520, partial [Candidatus Brocadiia bacterium]
ACNEQWTYYSNRTVATYTSKAGAVYNFNYDAVGNLLSKSGPLSYSVSWTYTGGNLLSTATDANSNVTTYQYDGSNRLWKIIFADDSVLSPTHPVVYAYDGNSQVSSKTDPEGNVESYTYDAYGNYATVINSPDNGTTYYTTTYSRDTWGTITQVTNPRGYSTIYEYDNRGYNTKVKVEYAASDYSETEYTHYNSGKINTSEDPLTNVTAYSYDSLGRRFLVQYADGNYNQTGFDANGNTVWSQNGETYYYNTQNSTNWYTQQYVYDTWNRCWQIGRLRINPAGGTPAFVTDYDETRFSADGNRVYYADYLGNLTTYSYDALNRLEYEIDPYTNHDGRTYDGNSNILTFTDKNGNVWTYAYDVLNRKATEVAPLSAPNNTTTWSYDYNGNVTQVTDRLGNSTVYQFDGLNRLYRTINAQLCVVQENVYDANGNRTQVIDAWLYDTDYTYSRQDRVLTITKPDTGVFTYEYDKMGHVTRTIDEEGADTRMTFDVMNRTYQVTYAYGATEQYTTTTTYDRSGRTSRFVDGVGNYTDTTYDPRGLTLSTDYYKPVGGSTHSATSYDYDVQGNCTSVTDALSNTTTLYYDDMNRQYETVKPSGATFSKTFDANGNVDTETDGESNTTVYSFDSMNRRWRMTDAQSNNFDKSFDAMGNVLTEVVSPDGGTTLYTTTYVYDTNYRMTSMTDPLNNAHLNWYDSAGRLTNYIDRVGNPVGFTYDSCGRTITIDHPAPLNPLTSMQTTITYDLCGRMTAYTSPEIDKEFVYDPLGRKISEEHYMPSWPTVTTLTYTFEYDARGRLTANSDFATAYENLVTTIVYDDATLTKTITEIPQNGNPQRVNIFQYDAAGNLTCKTVDTGMYENYYYDTDNRMYYQEIVDSLGTVLGYEIYTFDDNSQVDSDVTSGSFGSYSTTYTLDSRRLLTAEVRAGTNSYNMGYTYDGMYCRTQKVDGGTPTNYTYNGLGRITAATGGTAFTCTYDLSGNLTSKVTGATTESFEFDWKNNLVRYGNSTTGEDIYYGYDIGNARILKARPDEEEGGRMAAQQTPATISTPVHVTGATRVASRNPGAMTLTPGNYDICADIVGWKYFFHKTHGDRWLYNESETDGVNWWWTTQYTLDNANGIGFAENVQQARPGFPVGLYNGAVDAFGNNRVMYDVAQSCSLNAEYDSFGVESSWNGGFDLFGGSRAERNAESPNVKSGASGAMAYVAEDAQAVSPKSGTVHGPPRGVPFLYATTILPTRVIPGMGPRTIWTRTEEGSTTVEMIDLPNGQKGTLDGWNTWLAAVNPAANPPQTNYDLLRAGGSSVTRGDCQSASAAMLRNYRAWHESSLLSANGGQTPPEIPLGLIQSGDRDQMSDQFYAEVRLAEKTAAAGATAFILKTGMEDPQASGFRKNMIAAAREDALRAQYRILTGSGTFIGSTYDLSAGQAERLWNGSDDQAGLVPAIRSNISRNIPSYLHLHYENGNAHDVIVIGYRETWSRITESGSSSDGYFCNVRTETLKTLLILDPESTAKVREYSYYHELDGAETWDNGYVSSGGSVLSGATLMNP